MNIFKNLPRILGEKFPSFWGSGEEFDEIQLRASWGEKLLNVKRNITQLKGIVSHHEGTLNANYPKISGFTHKNGEKITMKMLNLHSRTKEQSCLK